jgi:hypothetical protein
MLLCIRGQLASSATVAYECLLPEVENKMVDGGVSVKVECALPACKMWCQHTRLEWVEVRDISSSEIGCD